jgi:hypothetical protein
MKLAKSKSVIEEIKKLALNKTPELNTEISIELKQEGD